MALSYKEYDKYGLGNVYNTAKQLYDKIEQLWSNQYKIDPSFSTNFSEMNTKSIYGWDSTMALALALDIYDKKYNVSTIKESDTKTVSNRLQEIMKSEDFYFLSVTGNVSFDSNGDRVNALYAFGNVIDDNGTVNYFGYFGNGDIIDVEFNDIIWPNDFIQHKTMPKSSKMITFETQHIDPVVSVIFIALSLLSTLFVIIIFIAITWKCRDNDIITNILWKLNMLTCIGCIMIQSMVILSAIDLTNSICRAREWLLSIAFTLIFMPLFTKTWKLSVIYSSILENDDDNNNNNTSDKILFFRVICCLFVDILILFVFTLIDNSHIVFVNGDIVEIHALHSIQMQYTICTHSITINTIFMIIMGIWKFLQLTFGLFAAFSVSRIGFLARKEIKRFDHFKETQSLLIATFLTIIIFIFAGIILFFIRKNKNQNTFYIFISSVALLISNIALFANVCPRLIAVLSHNEYKFLSSESENFRQTLREFIKKRHYDKKYIREIIHETQREKDLIRMEETAQLTSPSSRGLL